MKTKPNCQIDVELKLETRWMLSPTEWERYSELGSAPRRSHCPPNRNERLLNRGDAARGGGSNPHQSPNCHQSGGWAIHRCVDGVVVVVVVVEVECRNLRENENYTRTGRVVVVVVVVVVVGRIAISDGSPVGSRGKSVERCRA